MKFYLIFYTFLLFTSIKSYGAEEKSRARGFLEWILGLEPLTPGNSKSNSTSYNESSFNTMDKYHGNLVFHVRNTTNPDSDSHNHHHKNQTSIEEEARNETRKTPVKMTRVVSHSLSQDSESLKGSSKSMVKRNVDQMAPRYPKQLLPHHHQQIMYEQALLAQMQMQQQQAQQTFRRPYLEDYDNFYDSSSEEDYPGFPSGSGLPYRGGAFRLRTNLNDSDHHDDPNEDVEHVEEPIGAGGEHSHEHDEGDPEHFHNEPVEIEKETNEEGKNPAWDEEDEEESDAEDVEMEYRVKRALREENRQARQIATTTGPATTTTMASTTSTMASTTTTPYYPTKYYKTTKKGYYKKTTKKGGYYKTTTKPYGKKTTTSSYYPSPYKTTKKGGYKKTTTKAPYYPTPKKTTKKPYYPTTKKTTKKPYYPTEAPAPTCRCGLQSIRGENVNSYTAIRVRVNPWLVAISSGGSHLCSGFIINNKYILTAASCVKGVSKSALTVTSGWQSNSPTNHSVQNVKPHPKYDAATMANNIALLKISGLTMNQKMRPICLPTENPTTTVANLLTWINTDNKLQMLSTEVPVISDAQCQKLLTKAGSSITIPANTLCTGPPGQKTCIGDIGGPLQNFRGGYSYQAIALVSQTIGCRATSTPGVYTELFPYLKWIKNQSKGATWCSVPSSSSDGYSPPSYPSPSSPPSYPSPPSPPSYPSPPSPYG